MEITKYQQMKKGEHFQKGLKMFREGKVPKDPSVKPIWVKKLITQREWDNWYKYNNVYCNLGKVGGIQDEEGNIKGGKTKIGFLVAHFPTSDCELLTDEEMRIVDLYRKSVNVGPTPFEEPFEKYEPVKSMEEKPKFQDTLQLQEKKDYEDIFGENYR